MVSRHDASAVSRARCDASSCRRASSPSLASSAVRTSGGTGGGVSEPARRMTIVGSSSTGSGR